LPSRSRKVLGIDDRHRVGPCWDYSPSGEALTDPFINFTAESKIVGDQSDSVQMTIGTN
jgi:hypothetical protein